MQTILFRCAAATILLFAACSKKTSDPIPADNSSNSTELPPVSIFFTVLPFNLEEVPSIVPLGSLNPPAKTFPTRHTYAYPFPDDEDGFEIYAPGNLKLTTVMQFYHENQDITDYTLVFEPKPGFHMRLSHVNFLSDDFSAKVGSFEDIEGEAYDPGDGIHIYKEKTFNNVNVTAGELLGVAGIYGGVDFGLWYIPDANTSITLCPYDYFPEAVQNELFGKFGNFNGSIMRTAEPLCGSTDQNLAGTLQGEWYRKGTDEFNAAYHMAFVHDHVQPEKPVITYGIDFFETDGGMLAFDIKNEGVINRDPSEVTSGAVYCYDSFFVLNNQEYELLTNKRILVRLSDSKNLRVEVQSGCNCENQELLMTENAMEFYKK